MTLTTNCVFTPAGTSLSAVTWHMRAQGYRDRRDAVVSKEHIPWGNYNVLQRGGRAFREVTISGVFTTQATVQGLSDSYVGERGTLIWPRSSSTGIAAVLDSVDQGDEMLAGGIVMASLQFTVGAT